jgi:hypothetical protein
MDTIVLDRSAALRGRFQQRLLNVFRRLGETSAPLKLTFAEAATYWSGGTRWLPQRATVRVEIEERIDVDRPLRELTFYLASGPDELYEYYPFCCWIHADGKLLAIVEFDEPNQARSATIRVPVGAPVDVSFISELAGIAKGEERELSLLLVRAVVGRVVAPPESPPLTVDRGFSQTLFSLIPEPPKPIFVIGAYRSGTSVLAWALGQHPNVWPLEETGFLPHLGLGALAGYRRVEEAPRNFFDIYRVSLEEYGAYIGKTIDELMKTASLRRWNGSNLQRLSGKIDPRGAYHPAFQLARSSFNPKQRWVDGTPENTHNVLLLRELFPQARFVLMVRDPFDVVASMLHFDRAGGEASSGEEGAAMWLRLMTDGLRAYRAFGPSVVRVVPFEDLATRPERALSRIFDFLSEAQFPQSALTYGHRINSSQLDAEQRQDIVQGLQRSLERREKLAETYAALVQATWSNWEFDEDALRELQEAQNDRIMRVTSILE